MVTPGPGLLPKAVSVYIWSQAGSVLTSMAQVANKSTWKPRVWAATCSLVGVYGPCFSWDYTDLSSLCWGHELLLLRAMSGSVVLLQPRSVLISVAPVTITGHEDAGGLGCHLCLNLC